MKYLFLLILLVPFISCKKVYDTKEENQVVIDYKKSEMLNLSDFIIDVKIISLQTNDDCIIGDISKV